MSGLREWHLWHLFSLVLSPPIVENHPVASVCLSLFPRASLLLIISETADRHLRAMKPAELCEEINP